jgi:hypothetical protein
MRVLPVLLSLSFAMVSIFELPGMLTKCVNGLSLCSIARINICIRKYSPFLDKIIENSQQPEGINFPLIKIECEELLTKFIKDVVLPRPSAAHDIVSLRINFFILLFNQNLARSRDIVLTFENRSLLRKKAFLMTVEINLLQSR